MALIARSWAEDGQVERRRLVTTVMSNLGLERFLAKQKIALHRTPVGDRYVVEAMRKKGCNLGGEQSGHIVLSDYSTDRRRADRRPADSRRHPRAERKASEVCKLFKPLPQILKNVKAPAKFWTKPRSRRIAQGRANAQRRKAAL